MKDTWNMTQDEARKYILQNWFDGDENVNAFVCGDEEYTAMAIAVEALEATKWHYPSRGEYPTLTNHKSWSDDVLCECTDGKYRVGHYINTMGHKSGTQWDNWRFEFGLERKGIVFRWQYIVPPKEEA